jgi:methionyl aminopeptidase
MGFEMISLKSPREIEAMRRAGRITAQARALAGSMIKPGVTTLEIDKAVRRFIVSQGAKPSFLGYGGFPGSACISVNEEVIHGIPGPRVLKEGDIVSIDVGAYIDGFHGDNAYTFACGEVSEDAKRLMAATKHSLELAIEQAVKGNRIGDIGNAVQTYIEAQGFSVVRDFVGHGIGRDLHEAPEVPNYGRAGRGPRLVPGMTIAIEPMVNQYGYGVKVLDDDWTTVTKDGGLSAHFENTVLITDEKPVILTSV